MEELIEIIAMSKPIDVWRHLGFPSRAVRVRVTVPKGVTIEAKGGMPGINCSGLPKGSSVTIVVDGTIGIESSSI